MRALLIHPTTVRVCQVLIGLIFAAAALGKLGDMDSFAQQVHHFRLLPVATENLVAVFLPWVELMAALALILGVRARAGALLTTVMMTLFTVAVLQAVVRGLDFECGCFGTADGSQVGVVKLAENLGMLVVAVIASLRPRA
jgi:putative oxidoreductase